MKIDRSVEKEKAGKQTKETQNEEGKKGIMKQTLPFKTLFFNKPTLQANK